MSDPRLVREQISLGSRPSTSVSSKLILGLNISRSRQEQFLQFHRVRVTCTLLFLHVLRMKVNIQTENWKAVMSQESPRQSAAVIWGCNNKSTSFHLAPTRCPSLSSSATPKARFRTGVTQPGTQRRRWAQPGRFPAAPACGRAPAYPEAPRGVSSPAAPACCLQGSVSAPPPPPRQRDATAPAERRLASA